MAGSAAAVAVIVAVSTLLLAAGAVELLIIDTCRPGDKNQQWLLNADGIHNQLQRKSDLLCVEAADYGTTNEVTIQLGACHPGDTDPKHQNQQWIPKSNGTAGVFTLVGKSSSRCLDREYSHTWGGVPVWLYDCHSESTNANQKWTYDAATGRLLTVDGGLCLTAFSLGRVTVHAIEHTHDDVGWLKDVPGYYIDDVRRIITEAYEGLMADSARTYTYVEIAFFALWWKEQTEAVRENVRKLVKEGRLEFTNAGWSMNDEASCHYSMIVDNMELGHLWLQAQFGSSVRPKAGWMVDPFGHTAGQAFLYARMGFEMFLFGRAPEGTPQDYHWIWRPFVSMQSTGNNKIQDIFTYFHNGYCSSPPDYTSDDKMKAWARERLRDAIHLRTSHTIDMFGCDFTRPTFNRTDKVIAYVQKHPELGVDIVYSSPTAYYEGVHKTTLPLDIFAPPNNDFNPYWTGYFTSRQDFKQAVRNASAYYHAATMLHALAPRHSAFGGWEEQVKMLNVLWMALGVAVHHDGLTGTSRPEVYTDYFNRINWGINQAGKVIAAAAAAIVPALDGASACPPGSIIDASCPGTQAGVTSAGTTVAVLNPLPWTSTEFVHMVLPAGKVYAVKTASGIAVDSQAVPWTTGTVQLTWQAKDLPALGMRSYIVIEKATMRQITAHVPMRDFVLENENVALNFDATGQLLSYTNKKSGVVSKMTLDILYYRSAADGNDGAYDFRANPEDPFAFPGKGKLPAVVYNGAVFSEVRVTVDTASNIQYIARLYTGESHLEVITRVGPVDISDKQGKNVILRLSSDLASNGKFSVDSNGLEMTEHTRGLWRFGQRPGSQPGKNYYPCTLFSKISGSGALLGMLTDKPEGVGSQRDGSLEHMVYRRLLKGDGKGMDVPLNYTTPMLSQKWVLLDAEKTGMTKMRILAQRMYNPPVLVAKVGSAATVAADWEPMQNELPQNVMLQNLQLFVANWSSSQCPTCDIPSPSGKPNPPDSPIDKSSLANGRVILRFAHIFAVNEDPELSKPATLNFGSLFSDWAVSDIDERSLTLMEPVEDMQRLEWETNPLARRNSAITIQPMDLRSFTVNLTPK